MLETVVSSTLSQHYKSLKTDTRKALFASRLEGTPVCIHLAVTQGLTAFLFISSFDVDSVFLLKGLNPGKAIAEIKKMMATYKEKKASA